LRVTSRGLGDVYKRQQQIFDSVIKGRIHSLGIINFMRIYESLLDV
jgi:hypothetical protein